MSRVGRSPGLRSRGLPWALVGALALACPDKPAAPPGRGLRVALGEGWVATPVGDRLEASVGGRTVLLLESKAAALPSADALAAAAVADGAQELKKESESGFVMVKYLLGGDGGSLAAFLGVRQVGARTVWCASTGAARPDEVEAGVTVCRALAADDQR